MSTCLSARCLVFRQTRDVEDHLDGAATVDERQHDARTTVERQSEKLLLAGDEPGHLGEPEDLADVAARSRELALGPPISFGRVMGSLLVFATVLSKCRARARKRTPVFSSGLERPPACHSDVAIPWRARRSRAGRGRATQRFRDSRSRQGAAVDHRVVTPGVAGHDHVVEHGDPEDVARTHDLRGGCEVFWAGRRIATGVTVPENQGRGACGQGGSQNDTDVHIADAVLTTDGHERVVDACPLRASSPRTRHASLEPFRRRSTVAGHADPFGRGGPDASGRRGARGRAR